MITTVLGITTSALGSYNLARFVITRGIRARRRAKRDNAMRGKVDSILTRLESVDQEKVLGQAKHILATYGGQKPKKAAAEE